ncbi:MAG: hypothetical protein IJJ56_01205 [Prevotella sp.]|nr:hypothetical protein [Prevotella sp.]
MNNYSQKTPWSENVILVDADYVDRLTQHMITNFGQMLERHIPSADFARWIDCVALDGGLAPDIEMCEKRKPQQTQVILIHGKDKTRMEAFQPSDIQTELNGKAFSDRLGEFLISAYPVEDITDGDNLLTEVLSLIVTRKEVRRVMVIPNAEDAFIYNKVREILHGMEDQNKLITLFAMKPKTDSRSKKTNFREDILGYSLLAALGIQAEEIQEKICRS